LYKKGDKPDPNGFKSVDVTTSPYQVNAGERLMIDTSQSAFVIDPSKLTADDQRFQIVDKTGSFAKNNLTIKGNQVAIALAPGGGDLILDTAPVVGQVYEFFVNGKTLYYNGVIENGSAQQ
jgi:hypothetical protein